MFFLYCVSKHVCLLSLYEGYFDYQVMHTAWRDAGSDFWVRIIIHRISNDRRTCDKTCTSKKVHTLLYLFNTVPQSTTPGERFFFPLRHHKKHFDKFNDDPKTAEQFNKRIAFWFCYPLKVLLPNQSHLAILSHTHRENWGNMKFNVLLKDTLICGLRRLWSFCQPSDWQTIAFPAKPHTLPDTSTIMTGKQLFCGSKRTVVNLMGFFCVCVCLNYVWAVILHHCGSVWAAEGLINFKRVLQSHITLNTGQKNSTKHRMSPF